MRDSAPFPRGHHVTLVWRDKDHERIETTGVVRHDFPGSAIYLMSRGVVVRVPREGLIASTDHSILEGCEETTGSSRRSSRR